MMIVIQYSVCIVIVLLYNNDNPIIFYYDDCNTVQCVYSNSIIVQ